MRCSGLVQDTVIEEPLVRSPGRIVALAHAGSIPLLAGKLAYGSQKVELQADERVQAPEGGEGSPGAVAVVANAAAHGQPVSLFDVGLVVLLVAAASRKAHSSPLAPVVKRVVDELTAVVCVQLAEGHWQTPRCFFYSSTHAAHPDAPDGLDFRPARRYVHHSQRRRKNPIQALTAVQNKVRLDGPRLDVLPFAPGADRYLRFQSCRRRSRPPRLPAQSFSPTPQLAVNRRRAHRDQSFTQACIQAQFAVSLQTCHQGRQHCGQQLAAHSVARFPYLHERLRHFRPVAWRPAPLLRHDSQSATPSQEPDRRLPVYARRLAKLIEDPALLLFSGPPVPWPHRSRVLVQGQPSHVTSFR